MLECTQPADSCATASSSAKEEHYPLIDWVACPSASAGMATLGGKRQNVKIKTEQEKKKKSKERGSACGGGAGGMGFFCLIWGWVVGAGVLVVLGGWGICGGGHAYAARNWRAG